TYDWDWAGAEREFTQLIELNPNNGNVHNRHAGYFLAVGRLDQARAELTKAQELEPLSLITNALLGRVFYQARQYEQAITALGKTLELDPSFAPAHLFLGWAYEQQARYPDAIGELQQAFKLSGGESEMAGALGHAYAVSRQRAEAEKLLAQLKEGSTYEYVAPFDVALICVGLGAKMLMFEWLEKAVEDRSTWLMYLKVDPRFDSIRSDPRYHDLLRRMKIQE